MGFIFSGSTRFAVDVTSQPIFPDPTDDDFLNRILKAVRTKRDITGAILIGSLDGPKLQLDAYYKEGRDNFILGLPSTDMVDTGYDNLAVKAVIEGIEGQSVTLKQVLIERPTRLAWGQNLLNTNNTTYRVVENDVFDAPYRYITDSIDYYDASETTYRVKGHYTFYDDSPINNDGDVAGWTSYYWYGDWITNYPTGIYYEVRYYLNSALLDEILWFYELASNVYPTLNVSDSYVTNDFYPIVPLRQKDININANLNDPLYISSKALLLESRVDLDDMITGVTKQEDGTTDIDNIDQISDIFYMLGVSLYGDTQGEKLILYNLIGDLEAQKPGDINYKGSFGLKGVAFVLTSGEYNLVIDYRYITKTTYSGVIGSVGTCETSHVAGSVTTHTWEIPDQNTRPSDRENETATYSTGSFTVRQQITSTTIQQYYVYGLNLQHFIRINSNAYKNTTTNIQSYTAGQALTREHKSFLLPLSHSDLDGLDLREIEFIAPRIVHIQVYASNSVYVNWYNSGLFIAVIQIVSYYLLFNGIQSGSDLLLAATKQAIMKHVITRILVKLFEEVAGDEFLEALLAIATVYVLYNMGQAGNPTILKSAVDYMALTTAVIEGAGVKTEAGFNTLTNEMDEWQTGVDLYQAEIDNTNAYIAGYERTGGYYDVTDETPSEFFDRTINPNPGSIAFDHLNNYFDINLNLDNVAI